MPFNALFLNHLLYHQTSYTESGVPLSIKPNDAERVYFFHIDNDNRETLKSYLGISGEGQRVCDLLIYYENSHTSKKILCLAELKGKDVKGAVEQIKSIHSALSNKINRSCKSLFEDCNWAAYVRSHKRTTSPSNTKIYKDELDCLGIKAEFGKRDFDVFLRKI